MGCGIATNVLVFQGAFLSKAKCGLEERLRYCLGVFTGGGILDVCFIAWNWPQVAVITINMLEREYPIFSICFHFEFKKQLLDFIQSFRESLKYVYACYCPRTP